MTTGEGGVAVTEDDELARRLRLFRTHGIAKEGVEPGPTDGGWYYEMQELGFNYRITDFQCALGLSQLERLDAWVERRNEVAARYRELLVGEERVELPPAAPEGDLHGYHLFVIRVREGPEERLRVFSGLRDAGIGVQVHYIPVYRLPYYRDTLGYPQDEWPATEEYYGGAISLPIFPAMTDARRGARGRHAPRAAVSFRTSFEIGGKQVGGGAPVLRDRRGGRQPQPRPRCRPRAHRRRRRRRRRRGEVPDLLGRTIYSSKTPQFEYLKDERTPQELLEAIALPREWQPQLAEHARTRGIDFFSSPFDHEAVDQLAALGVPAMKIASFEIVDLPLIRRAAATGIPLILSTGMATYGEIEDALGAAADEGQRAGGAAALRLGLPVAARDHEPARDGDHARGVRRAGRAVRPHRRGSPWPRAEPPWAWSCSRSTSRSSREMEGPDHPFALEPDELTAMVAAVREVEAALGNGRLEGPSEAEAEEMYSLARRSIVAVATSRRARRSRARCSPPSARATASGRSTSSSWSAGPPAWTSRPTTCSPGRWSEPRSTRRPLAAETLQCVSEPRRGRALEAVVRGALPSWAAAMKSASSSR